MHGTNLGTRAMHALCWYTPTRLGQSARLLKPTATDRHRAREAVLCTALAYGTMCQCDASLHCTQALYALGFGCLRTLPCVQFGRCTVLYMYPMDMDTITPDVHIHAYIRACLYPWLTIVLPCSAQLAIYSSDSEVNVCLLACWCWYGQIRSPWLALARRQELRTKKQPSPE